MRIFLLLIVCLLTLSCGGAFKPKKVDTREVSTNAQERARRNIETGRGTSLQGLINKKTTYEFSTANPMWRASLETLDFLPLTTVDYSGGLIISDWYSDSSSSNDSLKITVRFLSNEVAANSLKIIVHQRTCNNLNQCVTQKIDSKIEDELRRSILKKAVILQKQDKTKKKK